jgi:hypothetical protein
MILVLDFVFAISFTRKASPSQLFGEIERSPSPVSARCSLAAFAMAPSAVHNAARQMPSISARTRSVFANSLIARPPTQNAKPAIANKIHATP